MDEVILNWKPSWKILYFKELYDILHFSLSMNTTSGLRLGEIISLLYPCQVMLIRLGFVS